MDSLRDKSHKGDSVFPDTWRRASSDKPSTAAACRCIYCAIFRRIAESASVRSAADHSHSVYILQVQRGFAIKCAQGIGQADQCGESPDAVVPNPAMWPRVGRERKTVRPLTVKESMQGESKSMNGVSLLAKRDGAFLRTAERAPSQRVHRHANASRLATSRSTSSGRKPRPEGEAGS